MSAHIRRFTLPLAVLSLTQLTWSTGCSDGQSQADKDDEEHEKIEVPEDFAGRKNPFTSENSAAVTAGEQHYVSWCKNCHGSKADGKGDAANELEHRPANLVDEHAAKWKDDYFLFRISEGDAADDMPAFGSHLTDQRIWQIITYLRTLQGVANDDETTSK